MVYDCGVNLCSKKYGVSAEKLVEHSIEAGLTGWLLISNGQQEWQKNLEFCKKFHSDKFHVKMTIGVHPHNARFGVDTKKMRELIVKNREYIVAIGECGLDYDRNFSPPSQQQTIFKKQLQLAHELDMPVYLHERKSHDDFFRILSPYNIRGIVHCFTGSLENMKQYLEKGLYIGITGWICDDIRGIELCETVRSLPFDRLIVETDSPFLAPLQYKRKWGLQWNQPDSIWCTLLKLSDIYGVPDEELVKTSIANAVSLFGL